MIVLDVAVAPRASVTVIFTEKVPVRVNALLDVTVPGEARLPVLCPFPLPQLMVHGHGPSPTSGSVIVPRTVTLWPRRMDVEVVAASVTVGAVLTVPPPTGVTVHETACTP